MAYDLNQFKTWLEAKPSRKDNLTHWDDVITALNVRQDKLITTNAIYEDNLLILFQLDEWPKQWGTLEPYREVFRRWAQRLFSPPSTPARRPSNFLAPLSPTNLTNPSYHLEQLYRQIEELRTEKSKLKVELARLQEQLKTNNGNQELVRQIKEREEKFNELKNQLRKIKAERDEKDKNIAQERTKYKAKIKKLETELDNKSITIAELQARITQLELEVSKEKKSLTKAKKELEELTIKIQKIENLNKELQLKNKEMEEKLKEVSQKDQTHKAFVDNINRNLKNKEDELKQLNEKYQTLEKKQTNIIEQSQKKNTEYQKLQQDLERMKNDKERLEREKTTADNYWKQLEREKKGLNHERQKSLEINENSLRNLQTEIRELKVANEELSQKLITKSQEWEEKWNNCEQEKAALIREITAVKEEKKYIEEKITSQIADRDLVAELARVQQEKNELEKHLEEALKKFNIPPNDNGEKRNTWDLILEEAHSQKQTWENQLNHIKNKLKGKINDFDLEEYVKCRELMASITTDFPSLNRLNLLDWIKSQSYALEIIKELETKLGSIEEERINELLENEEKFKRWERDCQNLGSPNTLINSSLSKEKTLQDLNLKLLEGWQTVENKENYIYSLENTLKKLMDEKYNVNSTSTQTDITIPPPRSYWKWIIAIVIIIVGIITYFWRKIKTLF